MDIELAVDALRLANHFDHIVHISGGGTACAFSLQPCSRRANMSA